MSQKPSPASATSVLTADDLGPLVAKLSPQEQIRLAYYAMRIARSLGPSRGLEAVSASLTQEGLPDLTEFHRSLGSPYPGNTVVEMRDEEDR